MLRDSYGRIIDHLRISLTDRCNLNCFYCVPESGIEHFPRCDILSMEELEYLVRFFHTVCGIDKVRFTGGEPLLRKGIECLLESLCRIADLSLHITTNGILVKDKIKLLKDAGVKVNVSLDTLDYEKFKNITGSYNLDRVIEGIDLLIEHGIQTKLNMVILKGINDDEIFDLIDFASVRATTLRFIEYMPLNGVSSDGKFFVSENEIRKKISELYDFEFMGNEGAARVYRLSNGAKVGFISTISHPGCTNCSRMRLTADGRLVTCMFDDNSYSLKRYLRPPDELNLIKFVSESIYKKPLGFKSLKERGVKPSFTMRKLGG